MSTADARRLEIRAFVSRRKELRDSLRSLDSPGKTDLPALARLNRELREVESDLLCRLLVLFVMLECVAGRTVEF